MADVSKIKLGSTTYNIKDTSKLPLSGGTITGTLILSKTQDASGTANNSPALIVGGAATSSHLEFDSDEIMAKSNGTTASNLYLNHNGGIVYINAVPAAKINGTITSGQVMIADGTSGGIKTSGYTIATSVPSGAKFTDTNTWRPVVNGLTSDATDQSLSAAQGKALKSLVDGKAASSHTHYYLTTIGDQRSTATTPDTYKNTFSFLGLKNNSTVNSPSSDTYSYLVGLRGWADSSGGDSHELAFNNTGIYWRHGATSSWGSWARIYTTANKPTYSDVGAAAASHSHSYLPLSGGTLTGALTVSSGNVSLSNGLLKITKNSNTITIGSENSEWGHIQNSANKPFYFNRDVHVDGDIYKYNGAKVSYEGHTHNYITKGPWWSNSDTSKKADNLTDGTVFAYSANHGTPTTGTLVAFSCTTNSYQLQIQGGYSDNTLRFRNKNGDNNTWGAWRNVYHSGNTTTTSIGSASGWSAGSAPTLGTAIAADDITAWTTNTPTAVTKKTVVTGKGTLTKIGTTAVSNGVLDLSNVLTDFTLTTGDSVSVTAGTKASLSYTARSIPNVTSVGSVPSLTVTNVTNVLKAT